MSEIRPGVWRLRAYAGRRANGTPVQITKTVRANEARPGAGRRLAERELAAMVAYVSKGNVSAGAETLGELLDAWLAHIEPDRSPTTMRKYRDIADRVVRPELGKIKLKVLTARQLDGLYAKLTAKGNKPATVQVRWTEDSGYLGYTVGPGQDPGTGRDRLDRSSARCAGGSASEAGRPHLRHIPRAFTPSRGARPRVEWSLVHTGKRT